LRPTLIEINDEFQTNGPPQIRQRNISADWFQFYVRVERKDLAVVDEAVERVAVEVVAVRWIGAPIGIGVMRRDDDDSATGFRNAMAVIVVDLAASFRKPGVCRTGPLVGRGRETRSALCWSALVRQGSRLPGRIGLPGDDR